MQKFVQNKKFSDLGPKLRGNFEEEFEKTNLSFEINTPEFINRQSFVQRKKT